MTEERDSKPVRVGTALSILSLLCIVGVLLLWQLLQARIADNQAAQRLEVLGAVLGNTHHNNDLLESEEQFDGTSIAGVQILARWQARLDQDSGASAIVATIIEAETGNGYSGPIRMLVGIDSDDNVIAVRVSDHSETPGLGDQIDRARSDWSDQFSGVAASAENAQHWRIRQDGGKFDKISGATITSRAMVQTIALVVRWHQMRRS